MILLHREEFYLAKDPILHENYGSPYPNSNDIALLKLAVKVDLNIYTPACLPRLDADYTLFTGSVYGRSYPVILETNPVLQAGAAPPHVQPLLWTS